MTLNTGVHLAVGAISQFDSSPIILCMWTMNGVFAAFAIQTNRRHAFSPLVDDYEVAEGANFKPSLLERILKCPFTVFMNKSPHAQAETLTSELGNKVCLIEADGKLFHSPTGKRMFVTIHHIMESGPIAEHVAPGRRWMQGWRAPSRR